MRIVYLDIDTLRPDHLGCYGYRRNTSPNIDRMAEQGVRFEKVYVSDAPCLPSRASMFTGVFGIRSGVVGHGDTAADYRIQGKGRGFNTRDSRPGFIMALRNALAEAGKDLHTATFSSFAERHDAWWWYEGWKEVYNCGQGGGESAEEVMPHAIDWVERNAASRQDWLLHVNIWDPHTTYRAPGEFGNPFENEPIEDWYTEPMRQGQWDSFGPGNPQEPAGNYGEGGSDRQPNQVKSMDDYKKWIDGYDCGIAYGDWWIGKLFAALDKQGVLDETVIMITSDHGENMGELGVIGDHATADHITSRVPMIIRFPDGTGGRGRVDTGLYNQCDIAATLVEAVGGTVPDHWDGISYAQAFGNKEDGGREYVVFSQNAWSCQRSVRWDNWVLIRTYNSGLRNYPRYMLFDIEADPHELNNLAEARPELVSHGMRLIDDWHEREMKRNETDVDPMWTVINEGGPFHTRKRLEEYCQRLRDTGRGEHADFLEAHPDGLAD